MPETPDPYVLGHSPAELRRLAVQATLIDPITRAFLVDGGISAGQRVLDVGSGGGHVSFLAAELVGPAGAVVGVDRSPTAVAAANHEARVRGLGHVSFEQGDPAQARFAEPFDAVIGRYVLQFQPEPSDFLQALLPLVRSGGPVVFHELDWDGPRSYPASPLHDQACSWAEAAIRSSGARTSMGRELRSTFVRAGLAEPYLRMEAVMGGGEHDALPLEQVSLLVQSLLPAILESGVVRPEEVEVDTLLARMRAESAALGSVIFGRLQMGCWSRTP